MIELRDLRDEDADRLYQWRREPEVDRWMFEGPPASLEAHRAWFRFFAVDPTRRGWIVLLDGRPVGFVRLHEISDAQRRARWDWYIGDAEARGKGAGRAAQALGLELAFGELKLQKVWSEVIAANETALKAQAAAGFRREGYLRRHSFKNGEFRDAVLLSMLAEEWAARRSAVLADLRRSGLIARAEAA